MAKKKSSLESLNDLTKNKEVAKKAVSKLSDENTNLEQKLESLEKEQDKALQLLKNPNLLEKKAIANHKLTSEGRKRFTTMLRPDLKERVQKLGHDHGYSIADIVEKALLEYLKNYPDY